MEILIWTLPSLLLLLPPSLSYNLSHYTLNLPSDLRPAALSALSAENASYVSYHLKTSSRCRRDADPEPACPPAKFRRPDGVCNNVIHANWGARGEAMRRMVEPQYADGKSHPRVSTTPHALPSPSHITAALQRLPASQHKYVTTLVGAWGELLLQDLVTTVNPRSEKCCSKVYQSHPECYTGGKECREYVRSVPAVNEEQECQFKYRDQMNLATSYLDGSAIYGSTEEAIDTLRTFDAGLVNITSCAACATNALYAALLREHNRVAVNLAKLNRHWHDNTLFLEAKRVVAAEIQHITYNEFLTTVLGEESVMQSDLKLLARGHFSDYSSTHHAGVYNEVALTALPAFLSMVPASFMNKTTSTDTFALMVSQLIRTPAYMPSMHIDVRLRSDWDTSSLLVHMGRDHGIAAYPYWLRYCSGQVIDKDIAFEDLKKFGHTQEGVELLKMLYLSPMDIDLLPGAILESPLPGSLVGPTFSCLLKHQFTLLRRSDRFWYENDLPPSSLTPDQLQEIRKVTLAGLLCANTDGLNKIQPMAFVTEDPYLNARITCDQHPLPLLTPWIEMNHMTDLSDDILMDAMSKAEQEVIQRRKMEYESWATFGGVDPKSPTGTAASFSKANKAALKLANTSLLFEFASNEILNQLTNKRRKRQIFENSVLSSVFRDELTDGLQNVDVSSLIPAHALDFEPTCDENGPCDPTSPFRTFSGHCNNLRNPNLGKSLTTFARLLPAAYEDGISKPRSRSVTGVPLPNPRTVSTVVHPDISNLHTRYTLMVMQFAQFLDHDLTMTPVHKGFHESIPDCRSCSSARSVHPECNPFPIPAGDHYYPEVNVTSGQRMCFPFMRSLPGQQHLGPREQVNQNTAFLDASQVYGENACVCRDLKGFAGRMNSTHHPLKGKELLPQSPSHPECKAPSGYCFIAGDGRASEQPALTVIHTLFLREHNRLVEGLRGVNPHWDSEKLFEHARRIIIAQNQHITYNEFLPRLLSWNAVNLYGLKLLNQGYYKEYNPSCNPSIVTEFAAAAFRIGHSLLRPHIPRLSPTYQVIDPPILLRDGFFKPDMLMQVQMIDEISRGLVSTPMEALDQFITGEVTNHLFEDRRIPFSGIDLVAMNIQRARDHGIPSYNNYRALCNLKRATTFEDLAREIPPEVITRLKRIYPTVDDIDLFPGGMSERPLQGGLVGPTFACIIAIQFRQLRKCDRHWYENSDAAVRFTAAQLSELRKTTLAKVICTNLDIPSDMQRAALDLPSTFLNPRVECDALPQIDLSAWREAASQGCVIADRSVGVGDSAFPAPCTSCVCSTRYVARHDKGVALRYENSDAAVRFSAAQLSELRKTTLAKVICTNLDIPSDMQRAALDLPSTFLNPRVECDALPQIDLSAWREAASQGCVIADRSVGVGDSAFPTPCTSCVCTNEGAQCASLRVTDCTQLMREWPRDAILRDDVCTAQCGFLLRQDLPARASSLPQDLVPPQSLSRHVRARQLNNVHFSQGFTGFKLPDLTPFLRV